MFLIGGNAANGRLTLRVILRSWRATSRCHGGSWGAMFKARGFAPWGCRLEPIAPWRQPIKGKPLKFLCLCGCAFGQWECDCVKRSIAAMVIAALCTSANLFCAEPAAQSCVFPRPAPLSTYTVFPRVTYLRSGGTSVKLDLYVPKHPARPPLIVQLHGGGWASGSGAQPIMAFNAKVLSGQGFAVASVDYPLTVKGANLFPAAVQDVRCAVQWLKSHGRDYGYDGTSVGALGFSAGANLAALLGTAAATKGDFDNPACSATEADPSVRSVAAFYAPTNLGNPTNVSQKAFALVANYLGTDPLQNEPVAERASPITYVSPQSAPFFIVHGRRDNLVPVLQQTTFVAALRAAQVSVDYIELPDLGHGFDPFNVRLSDQLLPTTCALLAFFHSTLTH